MIRGELFSQDMVKAFLENRKSRTSRPIKGIPAEYSELLGDIIYARETWCDIWSSENGKFLRYGYKADGIDNESMLPDGAFWGKMQPCWPETYYQHYIWHPSIHMPREAARLFFRVTDVKVQNIKDVTEQDAVEDGFIHLLNFRTFWREQYGTDMPWMWVYCLKPITKEEALRDER